MEVTELAGGSEVVETSPDSVDVPPVVVSDLACVVGVEVLVGEAAASVVDAPSGDPWVAGGAVVVVALLGRAAA